MKTSTVQILCDNNRCQIRRKFTSRANCIPKSAFRFREISLAPTKTMSGEIEVNEPVRVYDTSGPWGDPDFHGDVTQGLPPLRAKWIRERGDVEEHRGSRSNADGRWISLREACRACAAPQRKLQIPRSKLQSNLKLRLASKTACGRSAADRLRNCAYARQGIITPEMEFIAIRENLGSARGLACRIRRLAECFFNCPQFVRPSACWRIIWCKHPRRNHT